jgi:hypothetical protein
MDTSSAEDSMDSVPEAEGGVPKVGDIIEGKIVVDPRHMLRGERGRYLPGQRSVSGIMPGDSKRAVDLRSRQVASWARGGKNGLRKAVEQHAEREGITLAEAAEVYAEELGKGILANAMDKPHDASRALVNVAKMAQLIEDRQRASTPAVAIQVNIGERVAESLRVDGIVVEPADGG